MPNKTSFKQAFISNFFLVGSYTWTYQLIRFAFSLLLARILLPSDFGFVAIIQIFTGFLLLVGDMGLSYSVMEKKDRGNDQMLDGICLWLGFVQVIILLAIAYPISLFYGIEDLFLGTCLLGIGFLFFSIGIVPRAIIRRDLRMGLMGRIQLFSGLGSGIVAILFALNDFSYWSLIAQEISFFIFWSIGSRMFVDLRFNISSPKLIGSSLHEIKGLIKNVTGFRVANYMARNWDNAIIGKKYGDGNLGYYSRGYSFIYLVLSTVSTISNTLLFPILKKSESEQIVDNSIFVIKVLSLLSLPIASVLIVFPEELTLLLWGKQWLSVAPMLPYFGIVLFIQMQSSVVGEIFIAVRKEKKFLILGLVNSSIMIIGITWGAMYSLYDIPKFYAYSNLLLAFVFTNYWAFYKSFNFKLSTVFKVWGVSILILFLLLIFIDDALYKLVFLGAYWFHVIGFNLKYIFRFIKRFI